MAEATEQKGIVPFGDSSRMIENLISWHEAQEAIVKGSNVIGQLIQTPGSPLIVGETMFKDGVDFPSIRKSVKDAGQSTGTWKTFLRAQGQAHSEFIVVLVAYAMNFLIRTIARRDFWDTALLVSYFFGALGQDKWEVSKMAEFVSYYGIRSFPNDKEVDLELAYETPVSIVLDMMKVCDNLSQLVHGHRSHRAISDKSGKQPMGDVSLFKL